MKYEIAIRSIGARVGAPASVQRSIMRKLLLTTASGALALAIGQANAADMPYKAPPPKPHCLWGGWYVGANAGYAWGVRDPVNDTETFNRTLNSVGNAGELHIRGGYFGLQTGRNFC